MRSTANNDGPRGDPTTGSPRGTAPLPRSPFPLWQAFLLTLPIRYMLVDRRQTFVDCGIRAGDTVLELGAGTGFWTGALMEHLGARGHLYAQDVQPEMIARMTASIAHSAHRDNVTPLLCSSVDLPIEDGALDAVFAAYVLEEIDREGLMTETAAELARLVKVGGALGVREHRWGVSVGRVRTIFATLTRAGFACDEVTSSRFSFAARFTRRARGSAGA